MNGANAKLLSKKSVSIAEDNLPINIIAKKSSSNSPCAIVKDPAFSGKANISIITLDNKLKKKIMNVSAKNGSKIIEFDPKIEGGLYRFVLESEDKELARGQLVVPEQK